MENYFAFYEIGVKKIQMIQTDPPFRSWYERWKDIILIFQLLQVLHQLEERDGALQQMKRMKDESEKEVESLKRRINFLDKKLTQVQ